MTGPRFSIIGENIHASRIVKRGGKHVVPGPDGRESLGFHGPDGVRRFLPIPDRVRLSMDGEKGRIKHVQAALVAGMSGAGSDAVEGRGYLQSLALRQMEAGAAWLDLNVDEISANDAERQTAMRWLVGVIEPVATVPLSLDSSSPAVLREGVEAVRGSAERPLINSASLERLEVLDYAAEAGCPVVLSAAGTGGLPSGSEERVTNAVRMVEHATARGIRPGQLFIDPLVLPAAVRVEATAEVLAAVGELRRTLGTEIHITGGLSNVSFGLPARRIINDVFIALFVEAGGDSGIIDPVSVRSGLNRASRGWLLATELLLGRDPCGRAFLRAYRAGELAAK
ncbi:MAG: dihydropteroate synthase [Gemmatimonadota bacterium]|nr:dihydropteroate synthase [Gemmatimonadota bacterium]